MINTKYTKYLFFLNCNNAGNNKSKKASTERYHADEL